MEKISVVISFFCLFAVGVHAWPHGSVASCPEGPAPECPYVPSGIHDYKFPHPNDCHYFIHCDAGGQPICKECAAELHFNNDTKDCDWPANAKCENVPVPTVVPTEAPLTTSLPPVTPAPTLLPTAEPTKPPAPPTTEDTSVTTAPTPEPEFCGNKEPDCPECDCGDRRPHPDECEWYFECEDSRLRLHKCQHGWHFDPVNKVCDYPCNVGCGGSTGPEGPIVTPPPAPGGNETCPSTGGKAVPTCPAVDPEFSVFFPHPADCGWFYHCSHGIAYCKNCPADLHWNAKKDTCDWPADAGCSV